MFICVCVCICMSVCTWVFEYRCLRRPETSNPQQQKLYMVLSCLPYILNQTQALWKEQQVLLTNEHLSNPKLSDFKYEHSYTLLRKKKCITPNHSWQKNNAHLLYSTLSYLLLDPKPKIKRCPWESVHAKCWPSGEHLQSNTAPCPWPSIWNIFNQKSEIYH